MATKAVPKKTPAPVPQPPPARKRPAQPQPQAAVEVSSRAVATTAPAGGTSVALSDRLKRYTARQREEINKAPGVTGNMISFRGGSMTLNDAAMGNEIPIIVLAAQFERTYYPGAFIAGEAVVPSCYSRDGGDNGAPDSASAFPQHEDCKSCQWNQFESAREGSGKACKEGLKLAVVHADNVIGGKAAAEKPMLAQARLSVLNAKLIRTDLIGIQAQPNIDHTVQALVTLTCVPDARSQYRAGLRFEGYNKPEVVDQLVSLIDGAEALLKEDYPATMAVDPKEAAAKAGKGNLNRTVKSY